MLNEVETGSRMVGSGLGCAKELFPSISNCLSIWIFNWIPVSYCSR